MPEHVQLSNTMNFWANSLQPVAGATGVISRVQLPAVGHVAISVFEAGGSRSLPASAAAGGHDQQRNGVARHQAQHRAQCRANCMSKANF